MLHLGPKNAAAARSGEREGKRDYQMKSTGAEGGGHMQHRKTMMLKKMP